MHLVLHFLLLLLITTYASLLLALELVIEQEERLLVGLRRADNREHALASFVMRFLCDGDLGSRQASNLGDFGSIAANDTADHVGGDGDVLGAEVGGWGRRGSW